MEWNELVTVFPTRACVEEALPSIVEQVLERITIGRVIVLFRYVNCLEEHHRVNYNRWSLFCFYLTMKRILRNVL